MKPVILEIPLEGSAEAVAGALPNPFSWGLREGMLLSAWYRSEKMQGTQMLKQMDGKTLSRDNNETSLLKVVLRFKRLGSTDLRKNLDRIF